MITINDLIDQVDLVSPRNQDALRDFIIRELYGIKETLKVAGECLEHGGEPFIKEGVLQNIHYYTKE